jgi:hypothetical protein
MKEGTRVKINLYPQWETLYPRFYRNFHGKMATVQRPPHPIPELDINVLVEAKGFEKQGGVYVPKGCCTVVD